MYYINLNKISTKIKYRYFLFLVMFIVFNKKTKKNTWITRGF